MNCHSEYLVLVGLFPPLVVHTRIAYVAICDNLVSAFTCQNEISLQTTVVIDIGGDHSASKDQRCMMFLTHECTKWEHFDMETDPITVHKSTSFDLLFLHGISVPFQIIFQPLVVAFSAYNMTVSQSIIGVIEDLGFSGMCPHEIVCYDNDKH